MIEVTPLEAIEKIKNEECVCIVWTLEGCPNCEHFEPLLEEVNSDLPHWNFYKIELELYPDKLYFEPHMYPTNFIFYKGERQLVAVGVAPKVDVLQTLNEITEGTFKTDKDIEREQLDALNK